MAAIVGPGGTLRRIDELDHNGEHEQNSSHDLFQCPFVKELPRRPIRDRSLIGTLRLDALPRAMRPGIDEPTYTQALSAFPVAFHGRDRSEAIGIHSRSHRAAPLHLEMTMMCQFWSGLRRIRPSK